MSGYNSETGLYDLTFTKTCYWTGVDESMDYYATQLRNKDLEVVKISGSYLSVKATEEQVKSALISKRRAESEAAWKQKS
jgi:hypothetical protein